MRFDPPLQLVVSKLNRQNLYAISAQKAVDRFKDQIRALTKKARASTNGRV